MESDVQETSIAEQQLSRFLPLPYRLATLIVLGKKPANPHMPKTNKPSNPIQPANPTPSSP